MVELEDMKRAARQKDDSRNEVIVEPELDTTTISALNRDSMLNHTQNSIIHNHTQNTTTQNKTHNSTIQTETEKAGSLEQQRKESLRNEARRLMQEALTESSSMHKSLDQPDLASKKMQRYPSNVSLGSQSDLRTLDNRFDDINNTPVLRHNTDIPSTSVKKSSVVQQVSKTSITPEDNKILVRTDSENGDTSITAELEEISQRISEVEKNHAFLENKIRSAETNSEEEKNLITEHLRLLNEKDSLVRRQDYLNVLSELNATTEKISKIQKHLAQENSDDIQESQESQKLMLELKELVDMKNDLSHELMDKEAEDEEETERRGRLLLETPKNFLRGTEQPMSASKRFFQAILRTN